MNKNILSFIKFNLKVLSKKHFENMAVTSDDSDAGILNVDFGLTKMAGISFAYDYKNTDDELVSIPEINIFYQNGIDGSEVIEVTHECDLKTVMHKLLDLEVECLNESKFLLPTGIFANIDALTSLVAFVIDVAKASHTAFHKMNFESLDTATLSEKGMQALFELATKRKISFEEAKIEVFRDIENYHI